MTRISRNELHKLCIEEAAKSPCHKRKVGAIIALCNEDGSYTPLAAGHNHNLADGPCECEKGETVDTVIHAEMHALLDYKAKWEGHWKENKMFVTYEPCDGCKAALLADNIAYEVVGDFMKFDSSKPRMQLVPASFGQAAARAIGYGAKKYKANNWRTATEIESYINAMQRHLDAWREGEEFDKDSGLSHLDHMAANLAFLIELKHLPKIKY